MTRDELSEPCHLVFMLWKGGDLCFDHVEEFVNIIDAWKHAAKEMVAPKHFKYGRIVCTWKGVRQFVMEID